MSIIHEALKKAEALKDRDRKAEAKTPMDFPETVVENPVFKPAPQTLNALKVKERARSSFGLRMAAFGLVFLVATASMGFLVFYGGIPLSSNFNSVSDLVKFKELVSFKASSQEVAGEPVRAEQTFNDFTLTGIIASGGEKTAIVNGQLVDIGDRIGGAEVIAIRKSTVLLSFQGEELVVTLY